MKHIWKLILCCVPAAAAAQGRSAENQHPDVYLITIDTLRADHVHCYGDTKIETPSLDALARDGVRFAQAFTPSPVTNTSHTTILTGLLPTTHGVTDFAIPLAKNYPTWAELLQKNGYQTAAFIGAVILDSKTLAPGLDRGFDYYDNFPDHALQKQHWGRVERRGIDVIRRAEKWMDSHPSKPRFVWIHLYDPHDPYDPPPPYSQIYKGRLYDGEIAYADSALRTLILYLKQHERYQNALITLVGDHGEGLGEHHEETHGIFLYDSTTHVPLILKLPLSNSTKIAARVVDDQVRTTDILPTVIKLLGVATSAHFDGESLTPYFNHEGNGERIVLGETDYPLRFGWAPTRSVRAHGFKFIEAPKPELYDLKADPGELTNNYEPWNNEVQKSREQLSGLRAKGAPLTPSVGAAGAETLEELRALGYLGPADARTSTNVPELSSLPDPKDRIEEQNLLHMAMMAAEEGRPADARPKLEKVLQLDPASSIALLQLGELELHAGHYAEASEYFRRAKEARPNDASAAFLEGQAREKSGDLTGSRDALESSLKLRAGQFDARLLLGKVYLQLKKVTEAEDQFEAALLLKPGSSDALTGVARAEISAGRFSDALRRLGSHQNELNKPEVFDLLAEAYFGLGDEARAKEMKAHASHLRAMSRK